MYQRGSHSKYSLTAHIVMVTKYRYKWLENSKVSFYIKRLFTEEAKKLDCEISLIKEDKNHIHFILEYTPTITISKVLHRLKQISTYYLWREYPEYLSSYYYGGLKRIWSRGYFVCIIGKGASYNTIKKYIRNQG